MVVAKNWIAHTQREFRLKEGSSAKVPTRGGELPPMRSSSGTYLRYVGESTIRSRGVSGFFLGLRKRLFSGFPLGGAPGPCGKGNACGLA
jgi:hypothetical protein